MHACRPPDAHAVDFPATFDIDFGSTVHGNAAAGSTRLGFQYSGEKCLQENTSPIGLQEVTTSTDNYYSEPACP